MQNKYRFENKINISKKVSILKKYIHVIKKRKPRLQDYCISIIQS